MTTKLKIIKIEFETTNGKVVDLSLDEAKDLYDQLHELFAKPVITIPSYPTYPSYPFISNDSIPCNSTNTTSFN